MRLILRTGILALSVFVLCFFSCKTEEIILHGILTGSVTDAETQKPLDKVTIRTFPSGVTSITSNDGMYFFKNLAPGEYELQASKPGYSDSKKVIVVTTANTQTEDIQMTSIPILDISDTLLDFGFDKTELSFVLENASAKNLTFVLVSNKKWISINPAFGELLNDTITVTVRVDRSILPITSISETIKVVSFYPEGSEDTLIHLNLNFLKDQDGNSYKTVKIGNQIWMAENLNTGLYIGNTKQSDNGIIEKTCGDNHLVNCMIEGGSYSWNEMVQYKQPDTNYFELNQGICPVGWHLPSRSEFQVLITYLGGNESAGPQLVITEIPSWPDGWKRGTNESGFSGMFLNPWLPIGWWTSSVYTEEPETAFGFDIQSPYNQPTGSSGFRCDFVPKEMTQMGNVRCLKNR